MRPLILLMLVMACTAKEGLDTYGYLELEAGQSPNVILSGTLEGAYGVVAFSLNQIPYRKVFKKDGEKYQLKVPIYMDGATLPIPDSLSVKLVLLCRNQVTPKLKIKIESEFLSTSPLESEVEFDKCVDGTTNKFFYVKIKDKSLPKIMLDSAYIQLTPSLQ
jgi:hypothetical protein